MNRDEVFQVSKDEYVGFLDQLKPGSRVVDQKSYNDNTVFKVYSKKTKKLLCARIEYANGDKPEFYVYEMPDDDEMQPPIPRRKIILQSREEVQSFLDALSQLQHDGTIS